MSRSFDDDSAQFVALRNDEEQYSLWPRNLAVPAGWRIVYGPASRAEVAGHVDRTWTDMRPRSARS